MSASDAHAERWRRAYDALTNDCGVVDFSHRMQLQVTGADRATFIHNLCTNDIKKLTAGHGCEAFVTNVQGRTLTLIWVFCLDDSLVIETAAEFGPQLIAHLDRYLITEDVQLVDRSSDWFELLLAGEKTPPLLAELGMAEVPAVDGDHATLADAGGSVAVRRVPYVASPAFLLSADAGRKDAWWDRLGQAGVEPSDLETFHMARMEAGYPWYPWDLSDQHLPQEVNRDQTAISFTKGCYLGQETVARLDALGHVNKIRCRVKSSNSEPLPVGAELRSNDKVVGTITSSAFSPRWQAMLGQAYVRVEHARPGCELSCGDRSVTVIPLTSEA